MYVVVAIQIVTQTLTTTFVTLETALHPTLDGFYISRGDVISDRDTGDILNESLVFGEGQVPLTIRLLKSIESRGLATPLVRGFKN